MLTSSSQNTSQKITIILGFVGDFINVIISLFSIFFIPLSITITYDNVFTVQNGIVLISNGICFLQFIFLFAIEIIRELWLINHLDYSKRYGSLHLSSYKDRYPHIFERLKDLNLKYFFVYRISRVFFYLNFIITSIILTYFYYLDYRTITALFLNFWFCHSKLSKGIKIAKDSMENDGGFSYYNTINLSFNRIDPKFKRHQSTSNPVSLEASMNGSIVNVFTEETRL